MKCLSRFAAGVAVLVLGVFAVQSARADELVDPTIEVGVTSMSGLTPVTAESMTKWTYDYSSAQGTAPVFFENTSGSTWTTLDISVVVGGTGGTGLGFTNDAYDNSNFPSADNITEAFTVTPALSPATGNDGVTTALTAPDSGGSGVANDDYLAVRFNNWPSGPPDTVFTFTVTEAVAAPEPSTITLLAISLLGLLGLAGFLKRRSSPTAVTRL